MKKCMSFLFIFILIIDNQCVYSQDVNEHIPSTQSKFSVFREPSYVLFGGGVGNLEPLLFEGDIAPYFMVGLNRHNKWGIDLSPRIIFRMYNTDSYPIRTPSFIPKASFFYHLVDNVDKNKDLFAFFSMHHHSNGQDGSFYQADSVTINTHSGNFSTNWISGGVYISRPTAIAFTTNDYKIYAAYNYKQEIGLDDSYGRLRFFFDFQSHVNLSKLLGIKKKTYNDRNNTLKQSVHVGWIADNLDNTKVIDSKRLLFRFTLDFKPSFLNDVTIFAQYDYGQDYYNIYYSRKLNVLRFGLATRAHIFN
jgi:hypothetical protein